MVAGLLTATVSSEVFQAAQPALLYLVPFTLLPLLIMAYLKVCRSLFQYQLTVTDKVLNVFLQQRATNQFHFLGRKFGSL